ncbi:MAG: glycoside hydrolase family 3 C-terminal domain-containing protein [bacterium]
MRIKVILISLMLFTAVNLFAQAQDINKLISEMTLEEKVKIVVGMGFNFPGAPGSQEPIVGQSMDRVEGAAGSTFGIQRLGIPSIVVADGPAGLRINPVRKDDSTKTYYATAFPIATSLASSWDPSLVQKVGAAIGNEVLEYGVDIILMPGQNIHRNPLCGRNFEYYSEDPLVTGLTSAAMVKGVQSNGVGTSIKHFAANNQETNRNNINEIISERALREIYLKGFEIAVKEAQPWTIMSSYNKISGTYTSEDYKLLTQIVRGDWGFKGFVMTDWFGGKDPVAQMKAGNDLLMPGIPQQIEAIINAVKIGTLDEKVLDRNVKNILNVLFLSPSAKGYKYSDTPDLKGHALISREAAAEGMVLLKNNESALPLNENQKVALFGNAAYDLYIGGTGSGDVNEAYIISLDAGLENAGCEFDKKLQSMYKDFIKNEKDAQPKPKNFFTPKPPIPEMQVSPELAYQLAEENDIAVVIIGRNSGEFADRKLEDDFYLSKTEIESIENISNAFHSKAKKVVAVLNIGGVIETASWRDKVDAILISWQPGQEGGNAIADVLIGKVNPSGKLTSTFPVKYEDVPSANNFPGTPKENPESVNYEEDIFIGYRYFLSNDVKPAYEFGYGLSYTKFEYGKPQISSNVFKDKITVSVKIKNTGSGAGKEVVQMYICAPAESMVKPEYELKGFHKTKLLQPGEEELVTFTINPLDLTSFDSNNFSWTAEKGEYKVNICSSSEKILSTVEFNLTEEMIVEKVNR